jgi:hypothetical protein
MYLLKDTIFRFTGTYFNYVEMQSEQLIFQYTVNIFKKNCYSHILFFFNLFTYGQLVY